MHAFMHVFMHAAAVCERRRLLADRPELTLSLALQPRLGMVPRPRASCCNGKKSAGPKSEAWNRRSGQLCGSEMCEGDRPRQRQTRMDVFLVACGMDVMFRLKSGLVRFV